MYRNRSKASLLALAAIAAALLALTGCQLPPTCYGVEPDQEVEQLTPCPPGWQPGETRNIREDEFEHLEVSD